MNGICINSLHGVGDLGPGDDLASLMGVTMNARTRMRGRKEWNRLRKA